MPPSLLRQCEAALGLVRVWKLPHISTHCFDELISSLGAFGVSQVGVSNLLTQMCLDQLVDEACD